MRVEDSGFRVQGSGFRGFTEYGDELAAVARRNRRNNPLNLRLGHVQEREARRHEVPAGEGDVD